jgi:pyruvate ferredoxin oxidoreductase gamma subunit
MKEIRWHARAGQGAKTASQLLAVALLRSGKSVQAFPEYGPERRGAPLRAYTRYDDRPIRRHDSVETPDAIVVLEPSLLTDPSVRAGLKPGGIVLDSESLHAPRDSTNLFMVGALAAALGEPPLATLQDAAVELLGRKADHDAIRAAVAAGWEARA